MNRFLILVSFLFAIAASTPAKPNLLLFLADDMTWTDAGCFGNDEVRTPFIDQLAADGIRFTKFYNSAPTCSPLRQSLYTGIYPIRNGAHPNHSRVYEGIKSLPHYLEPLGYRTAIVGKRHEAPAESFPFEMLGGTHGDSGRTPAGSDLPLGRAREFMARDPGQPWCLVVASNQPHTPWNRGDASAYPPDSLTVPPYLVDTPELRDGLSKYYAEITYMDAQVGRVLAHLEELNLTEETVVLWLSEQGSQFPFCKWTCYDTGIHAAAVLRWPGTVEKNRVSDALISYVDVVPTFVELAGGQPSSHDFDGKSFAPVLRGETEQHHKVVFATNTTRGIYWGSEAFASRAVTDGKWLYIRNLHSDEPFQNVITEKDKIFRSWRSVDSELARERVDAYVKRPSEELFSLENDPWCRTNLAGEGDKQVIRQSLSDEVGRWMKKQGDRGDATERSAEERQPEEKPWGKGGAYARQVATGE